MNGEREIVAVGKDAVAPEDQLLPFEGLFHARSGQLMIAPQAAVQTTLADPHQPAGWKVVIAAARQNIHTYPVPLFDGQRMNPHGSHGTGNLKRVSQFSSDVPWVT